MNLSLKSSKHIFIRTVPLKSVYGSCKERQYEGICQNIECKQQENHESIVAQTTYAMIVYGCMVLYANYCFVI